MKITDVRAITVDLGKRDVPLHNAIVTSSKIVFTLVEVTTDDGLKGINVGYGDKHLIEGPLRSQLVGEDPRDLERLWERMYRLWRKPVAKGDTIQAIGGVDCALWDLFGKIVDLPVWRLLGGYRRVVPAYAAGGYYAEGKGLDELAAEMVRHVENGYRAVKMKVGRLPIPEDVERVRAVREAIGPNVDLLVDANDAWTAPEAIRFGRAAEQYDLYWLEEPVSPDDLRGGRDVRRALDVPLATGEIEGTRWGFKDLIEQEAADIIQADGITCGGISEFRKIAAMASAYHLPVAPHGNERLVQHLVAGVSNGLTVECYPEFQGYLADFVAPVDFRNGVIHLSDRPGLGLEVDWAAVERHVDH